MPLSKEALLELDIIAKRLFPTCEEIARTGNDAMPVIVVVNGEKVIPTVAAIEAAYLLWKAELDGEVKPKSLEERVAELEARVAILESGK